MSQGSPSNRIGMVRQLGLSAARFAWYTGVRRFGDRVFGDRAAPRIAAERPLPSFRALVDGISALAREDASAVGEGLIPAQEVVGTPPGDYLRRLGLMFRDMPEAAQRRARRDTETVREADGWDGLPAYYTQDFHFQAGGHLSDRSARLYDVQVETLFSGSAALMRRAGLRKLAEVLRGRDQRRFSLVDMACGTGRFLREARLAYPMIKLTGVDLSPAYLDEARRHLAGLRAVDLIQGDAEHLPFADGAHDVVTAMFLFHELPPEVRRGVAREVARVLKPGGLFVFVDSLQFGDRPAWDGLLEIFPARFHEPYFRNYVIDDLDGVFAEAGLRQDSTSLAFLSKVMVWRKA